VRDMKNIIANHEVFMPEDSRLGVDNNSEEHLKHLGNFEILSANLVYHIRLNIRWHVETLCLQAKFATDIFDIVEIRPTDSGDDFMWETPPFIQPSDNNCFFPCGVDPREYYTPLIHSRSHAEE
jgi:hypothetical protein